MELLQCLCQHPAAVQMMASTDGACLPQLLQGIYVTQYLPNAPINVKTVAQQFNAAMGDIS